MSTMTLEQAICHAICKHQFSDPDRHGRMMIDVELFLRDFNAAKDAHLAQPAQAVDVGSIREVARALARDRKFGARMSGGALGEFADKLTRAISGENSGRVWKCVGELPHSSGHTFRSECYARTEAAVRELRDLGYSCELLPASPAPDKEGA